MNKKLLIAIVALAVVGFFGYRFMQPAKVTLSQKVYDDSKLAKLRAGMPLYDNMCGIWKNDTKTVEIKDGKFIEKVNGSTKEYVFAAFEHLPEACFPKNMSGDAVGFTIRNGKEVRCFGIRDLQSASFAYVEVTNGEDIIEAFTK
jgi:hypothetical protein